MNISLTVGYKGKPSRNSDQELRLTLQESLYLLASNTPTVVLKSKA